MLAAAGVVVEAGLFLFLFLEVGVKYFLLGGAVSCASGRGLAVTEFNEFCDSISVLLFQSTPAPTYYCLLKSPVIGRVHW